MVYRIPASYKCIKCDYEFLFSPDHSHAAPVLSVDERTVPMCPVCYAKFLMEHVGMAYSTHQWRPEGSDFDLAKKGELK